MSAFPPRPAETVTLTFRIATNTVVSVPASFACPRHGGHPWVERRGPDQVSLHGCCAEVLRTSLTSIRVMPLRPASELG